MAYKNKNDKEQQPKFIPRVRDIPVDCKVNAVNWARSHSKTNSASTPTDFSTMYDTYELRHWRGSFKNGILTMTAMDEQQALITNQRRTVNWKPKYANTHIRFIDFAHL